MRIKLIRKAGEGANKSYTFTWWDNAPTADRRPTTKADLKNCLHKEIFLAADDAEALKLAVEYLCDYIGDDPEDVADTPEEVWDYFNGDWGAGDPIPMVLKQRSRVVKDSGFNPNDESDNGDESKKTEGHDGWDGWEEVEGLEDTIDAIENLTYELRNCIRGAKTHCKDWKALAHYIKGLAENLDDAAKLMAYRRDDEGEDESKRNEDKRDLEAIRAKFCDNPDRAKIGRLAEPYEGDAVFGTQTWSDGTPVTKCWHRDNRSQWVSLKKGTRCIALLDPESAEVEAVWIPYRNGWLSVDGSDIEVNFN